MSLKEDARKMLEEIFGSEIAKQVVDKFDNPEDYPKDFLEECEYFLARLVGKNAAKKKLQPLYEKYAAGRTRGRDAPKQKKTISLCDSMSFMLPYLSNFP